MVAPTKPSADITPKKTEVSPTKKEELLDTSNWLTREESARLLRVSPQTIKNYEQRQWLHPQRVLRLDGQKREQLTVVYDPAEVKALPNTYLTPTYTLREGKLDTSTWYTRAEATAAMNIAPQTLKNYEKRGVLKPLRIRRPDARGHEQVVVVYNPKELSRIPRGGPFISREVGELNARANEMFAKGFSISDVVIELRETSDVIRQFHEKWLDDGGSRWVITPEAKEVLEQQLGPFADVAELIDRVTAKCSGSGSTQDPAPS